jgi:hypothetical protein
MIYGHKRFICIFYFLICQPAILQAVKAVFIKPVTHLCSEQLSSYGVKDLEYHYNHQPLSGDTSKFDCMRTAQALFNEWCDIVSWDKETHEIGVQFSHFLVDKWGQLIPVTFWTLDDNVWIFEDEKNEKKYQSLFPKPIRYNDPRSLIACDHIVLIWPFYDRESKKIYSAGTRFLRVSSDDTEQSFMVLLIDPEKKKVLYREIPRQNAIACDQYKNNQERRKAFISLLQKWCSEGNNRIIPYVWGGASFIEKIDDIGFEKVEDTFAEKPIKYWQRSNVKPPVYGFDCSGLVMRVAQICGIPYWFKTTATALRHGLEVKQYDDLQNGDLLVWNGHVVIVSDKEKGLLIESAGYGLGYGKLHQISLEKRFGDISSYQDLFALKEKKGELIVLCKNGVLYKKIPEFKVISLVGKD